MFVIWPSRHHIAHTIGRHQPLKAHKRSSGIRRRSQPRPRLSATTAVIRLAFLALVATAVVLVVSLLFTIRVLVACATYVTRRFVS